MPLTNTPETLNILDPDFQMPEHCGGDRWSILHGDSLQILRQFEPNCSMPSSPTRLTPAAAVARPPRTAAPTKSTAV